MKEASFLAGRTGGTMNDRHYAGFWRRALAMMIDGVILYFIVVFLMIIGMAALWNGSVPQSALHSLRLNGTTAHFFMTWFLAAFLVKMSYFTYFHGTVGQTPGKMILRIRVEQIDGEAMTLGIGFLRWVGYIISSLPLYLGFVWIGVDPQKRGWHDRIAGTIVVRMDIGKAGVPLRAPTEPDENSLDKEGNIL
jgi:uncharacterized RDD family membrane protein YckC